ncbi:MAG: DUF6320 domain-containing protein [Lachnospiraceae bacterium]|nr:DUF6320 domain-containing protein [Lachnospiraceae bacterium]MDY4794107.1 DUF6320 domain-containing protein [Pararoseburia sp.]
MKTCPYCNITVGGTNSKCPICQNRLSGESTENHWPYQETLKKESVLYKLQLFIVLSLVIVSLALDFLLDLQAGVHWSVIVTLWLLAFEFGIIKLFRNYFSPSKVVTEVALIISLLLLFSGYWMHHTMVITDFIIPIICIGTLVTNFILILVDRASNAMVYLLCNVLVGALPYLVFLFMKHTIPFLWVLCLMISVITFIGACVFRGRQVWGELQKRFNM